MSHQQSISIRVNGRGNAWPLDLGPNDPKNRRHGDLFQRLDEYSNTSFSITAAPLDADQSQTSSHLLLDIGQGIVPFLVQKGEGFPDVLIVSHPHFDHISGLDWLVKTYARYYPDRKLPVYASRPCWGAIMAHFSYLKENLRHSELLPGKVEQIDENDRVKVTGYPVFHGDSAPGAMMILLEFVDGPRVLFTGDLLCPLLRAKDWAKLHGVDVLYADANTRFPYPRSGHWSIVDRDPAGKGVSSTLSLWTEGQHPSYLITPHAQSFERRTYHYFDQFLAETLKGQTPCLSIFQFVKLIEPKQVQLVHYSGYEDYKYHGETIMADDALLAWTKEKWANATSSLWGVPKPGDYINL